jgi:hypothetical protein
MQGGNFIGAEAEVLFRDRIVVRKSGMTASSIPKFDLIVPWPEADRPDGHLWSTIPAMITIAKVYRGAGTPDRLVLIHPICLDDLFSYSKSGSSFREILREIKRP